MAESNNMTVLLLLMRSNIFNWLTIHVIFYAQICKCQNMKHQKMENTGSTSFIVDMYIIITIIIIMRIMFYRN